MGARIINSVVAFHKSQQIEPYLADLCDRLAQDTVLVHEGAKSPKASTSCRFSSTLFLRPPWLAFLASPRKTPPATTKWGVQLGTAFAEAVGEGRSISMREGSPEMARYVDERIAERALLPTGGLAKRCTVPIPQHRRGRGALSHRAIAIQVMFAIGAGSETTRNTLGSLLFRLSQDPDLYAEIREDRSMVEPAVEEALRTDAPAQFMVRRCLVPETGAGGGGDSRGRQPHVEYRRSQFGPGGYSAILWSLIRTAMAYGTISRLAPDLIFVRGQHWPVSNSDWVSTPGVITSNGSPRQGIQLGFPKTGMIHGPETLRLRLKPNNG